MGAVNVHSDILIELREYIQQNIIPQYVNFDKAHQIDHVEKVIEESLKLASYYDVNLPMVYTIAAYHDLGLCAEADRIIDPEVTLRRTVQYGLSHYPEMDKEQQYARFRKHLNDKYAEGGYLKLWIPQSDNAGRLAELRKLITSEDKLIKVFDRLYLEEKTRLLL